MGATNALLGPPTPEGLAQPRGTEEDQRRTWVRFWEAVELQRLLVDNRTQWEVRFTHPLTEALSIRELLALPGGSDKIVWASGDATLERLGAVDWTNSEAYSFEVTPYQILEEMEETALREDPGPGRDPRPALGEATPGNEKERHTMMVSLTELLAVLLLAVCQHEKWKGKMVLYMGDNQVVINWINKRQAKHPFANYLLQLLAAIEACYGFFLHTAYLRTYHNVVADSLTRQEAEEVMRQAGVKRLDSPEEALRKFLDRGWQRRALIWAGQADADTAQALKLANVRNPVGVQKQPAVLGAMHLSFIDLSEEPQHYKAAFLSHGSQPEEPESRSSGNCVICSSIKRSSGNRGLEALRSAVDSKDPEAVWVDCQNRKDAERVQALLQRAGYHSEVRSISGRSLADQVWWHRWVTTATKKPTEDFEWVTVEDEPITAPLSGYAIEWVNEKPQDSEWEEGLLKLDSSMPYLGATKPKPCGTLSNEKEGSKRSLVRLVPAIRGFEIQLGLRNLMMPIGDDSVI